MPWTYHHSGQLREQLPLKQGLRLLLKAEVQIDNFVLREQLPLKQGLRLLLKAEVQIDNFVLREQLPLKQGLRLSPFAKENEADFPSENNFH